MTGFVDNEAIRDRRLSWAQKLARHIDNPWLIVHECLPSMTPGMSLFDPFYLRIGRVWKSKAYKEFETIFRNDIYRSWEEGLKEQPTNAMKETMKTKIYNRLHYQLWLPKKAEKEEELGLIKMANKSDNQLPITTIKNEYDLTQVTDHDKCGDDIMEDHPLPIQKKRKRESNDEPQEEDVEYLQKDIKKAFRTIFNKINKSRHLEDELHSYIPFLKDFIAYMQCNEN